MTSTRTPTVSVSVIKRPVRSKRKEYEWVVPVEVNGSPTRMLGPYPNEVTLAEAFQLVVVLFRMEGVDFGFK